MAPYVPRLECPVVNSTRISTPSAAADSRAPDTMRGLGFIVLVAGLVIPFLGLARWKALIEWWADQGEDLTRVSLAFALFGGLLLFYLFSPTI